MDRKLLPSLRRKHTHTHAQTRKNSTQTEMRRGQWNAVVAVVATVAARNCSQSSYFTACSAEGYFTLFTLKPAHWMSGKEKGGEEEETSRRVGRQIAWLMLPWLNGKAARVGAGVSAGRQSAAPRPGAGSQLLRGVNVASVSLLLLQPPPPLLTLSRKARLEEERLLAA